MTSEAPVAAIDSGLPLPGWIDQNTVLPEYNLQKHVLSAFGIRKRSAPKRLAAHQSPI